MRPAPTTAHIMLRISAGFLVILLMILLAAPLRCHAQTPLTQPASSKKASQIPAVTQMQSFVTQVPANLDVRKRHLYDSLTMFFQEFERGAVSNSLTVEQSMKISEQNSNDLAISESQTRSAADKIDEVRSLQNPTLGITGTYYKIGPIPEFVIPGSTNPVKLMSDSNYDLKFTAQYLLSNFGNLQNSKKAACLNFMQSKVGEDRVRSDLLLSVVLSFFNVVEKKGYMAVAEQGIRAKELQYKLARDNFEAGTFPRYEVIQANVGLKDAELLVIQSAKELELQKANLRKLLGLDQTAELDVRRPRFAQYPLPNLEECIELAYKERPEITQLQLAVEIAKVNVDLAYGGKNPVLLLVSTYDNQTQTFASTPSQWNLAFNFKIPVFDGGLTWAQVKQAKESLEQANLALAQLKRDIAFQVKSAHLSVMESIKKFDTAEANIEQATEAYDIALMRYQEGISTHLELDNALVVYLNAHANLLSAFCEYQRSWAALMYATGSSLKGVYYDQTARE